jgi:RsiW-degrading membrane proteinase PrsW (M82 family)
LFILYIDYFPIKMYNKYIKRKEIDIIMTAVFFILMLVCFYSALFLSKISMILVVVSAMLGFFFWILATIS